MSFNNVNLRDLVRYLGQLTDIVNNKVDIGSMSIENLRLRILDTNNKLNTLMNINFGFVDLWKRSDLDYVNNENDPNELKNMITLLNKIHNRLIYLVNVKNTLNKYQIELQSLKAQDTNKLKPTQNVVSAFVGKIITSLQNNPYHITLEEMIKSLLDNSQPTSIVQFIQDHINEDDDNDYNNNKTTAIDDNVESIRKTLENYRRELNVSAPARTKKTPSPNASPVKKSATTPVAIPSEEHLQSFAAGQSDFNELEKTLHFKEQQRSKKLYDYMHALFNPQFDPQTANVEMLPISNQCYQLVFNKIIQMVVGKLSAQQDFKNLYITSQQIDDACQSDISYNNNKVSVPILVALMKKIVKHFNNHLRTRDTGGNIVKISQEPPNYIPDHIIVTKNAFFYLLGLFNADQTQLETLYTKLYAQGTHIIQNGEYEK